METQKVDEFLPPETRLLAAVGYLPMFFLLPLFVRPGDKFCRFHAIQSGLLLAALTIFWLVVYTADFILGRILGNVILIGFIFKLTAWVIHYIAGTVISLLYIGLIIAGFIKAATGEYWRIPILNVYAERLNVRSV